MILTFDLVWIYHYQAESRPMTPWAFLTSGDLLVVWAVTAALAAVAVWYRGRQRAELQNLLDMRRELDGTGDQEIRNQEENNELFLTP